MAIGLIPFYSALHPEFDLEKGHRELFSALRAEHEVRLGEPPPPVSGVTQEGATKGRAADVPVARGRHTDVRSGDRPADLQVAFIASGGTEQQFVDAFPRLPRPVYLLTDGKHNSFAASLEIAAWVRRQGEHCEILHGDFREISKRLSDLASVAEAEAALGQARFGFVGAPSDWLIASSVDRRELADRFGPAAEDVALEELYARIDAVAPDEARRVAGRLIERSGDVVEPDTEALEQASAIYLGLKRLVEEKGVTALTLRCFDLVTRYRNTGCVALALLNDEGVMAGCEGDQQALFTVVVAHVLTGEVPFLANPAALDVPGNAVEVAHCMVPTALVRGFRLRSHFETGVGVAIDGQWEGDEVTICRIGGENLSLGWASEAVVESAPYSEDRCRTQLRLRLEEDVRYFLEVAPANHHVIVRGRWAARFRTFFEHRQIRDAWA
ncbi:MAG: hypothetical protein ACLFMV_04840 [Spirochaetaceae bacterium]